jgi:hypothetical protein
MRKVFLSFSGLVLFVLLFFFACKKQASPPQQNSSATNTEPATEATAAAPAPAPCTPGYYDLVVFPGSGDSYVYRITGTPSCGPVSVSVVGQVKCGGVPVRFMTGLSFDPASGLFYGTTGAAGSPANTLIRFTAATINNASCAPLTSLCAIALDISDIERNQVTGGYYAINRGTIAANQRIVRINVGTAQVGCLPCTISLNFRPRGLTFDCSGTMWVMAMSGANGTLLKMDPNGCVTSLCAYPGVITPPTLLAGPEMGLHYDCICCNRFITGNYDPTAAAPLLTDAIPSCFGAPAYNAGAGLIRPTVDFARP